MKQFEHVRDMISNYEKEIGEKTALTPSSNHLYDKGEGGLLGKDDKGLFHSTVAKGLFVSTRSRPDIIPTLAVLSGRVREPNVSDREKLIRLLKYLNDTRELH